jgi:phage gp46-like protein
MDAGLNPTTGDLSGERIDSLQNAIYLRLEMPLGSWWADPSLGSRLHELSRCKDVSNIAVLARQYAQQALAQLLTSGRATYCG